MTRINDINSFNIIEDQDGLIYQFMADYSDNLVNNIKRIIVKSFSKG
jgi:hypothetical protein